MSLIDRPTTVEEMWQWWCVYVRVVEAGGAVLPTPVSAHWPRVAGGEVACEDPPPVVPERRISPNDVTRADEVQKWLARLMLKDRRWRVSYNAVRACYWLATDLTIEQAMRRTGVRPCRKTMQRWRSGVMTALLEQCR